MTRKMWAPENWTEGGSCLQRGESTWNPVPVLVTSLEDAPDFEPGDRVRQTTPSTNVFGVPVAWHEYEIAHIYFDGERWCFYSTDRTRHPLAKYTKLPREKTVTLKVTGPEEHAEKMAALMQRVAGNHSMPGWAMADVSVERVEAPDER